MVISDIEINTLKCLQVTRQTPRLAQKKKFKFPTKKKYIEETQTTSVFYDQF